MGIKDKKKILGIPLTFIVIGMLMLVGVSAALVGHLSNKVTTAVTVQSPMVQLVSDNEGSTWQDSIDLSPAYGGEPLTFYVKTQNLANVAITGNVKNIVTSAGIICADFTSVMGVTTTTIEGGNPVTSDPYELIGYCESIGEEGSIQFSKELNPMTWAIGQVDITVITATFATDAVGEYIFTSQIMPTS